MLTPPLIHFDGRAMPAAAGAVIFRAEGQGWTSSKTRTAVSAAVAGLSGVSAALTPFTSIVPDDYKPILVLVLGITAALGAGLAAFNQSLATGHTSLPNEEVERLRRAAEGKR